MFLSISFLVGSAVGGIATIGGAIVGGFFIQFVPNLANDISDAAPWAIYGLAMLVFMYAMPNGVVGLARAVDSRASENTSRHVKRHFGGSAERKKGGWYEHQTRGGISSPCRLPACPLPAALPARRRANTARA